MDDTLIHSGSTDLQGSPPRQRPKPVRRITTGENAEGKSIILMDGPTPNHTTDPGSPPAQVLWATGQASAPGLDPAPAGHAFGFHSLGGSVLRIADFPPDGQYDKGEIAALFDEGELLCVRVMC